MKHLITILLLSIILISCNSNPSSTGSKADTKGDKQAITSSTNRLLGTYSTVEDGKPMQFVIEANGKGHENYHGEMRPFTWKQKGGKVFFTYDGEKTEWELPVNMEKGEILYGSLVYKKQ